MMQTWKYSLPGFLVPFAFVLSPNGEALLLEGSVGEVAIAFIVSALAVAGLAAATGQWIIGPARVPERVLAAMGGLILLYLEPITIAIGLGTLAWRWWCTWSAAGRPRGPGWPRRSREARRAVSRASRRKRQVPRAVDGGVACLGSAVSVRVAGPVDPVRGVGWRFT